MKKIFTLSLILVILTSCENNKKERESTTNEQTSFTTEVPQNPFLYKNSSQSIIHFNSAQTDATIHGMPEGDIDIVDDQVSFIPASIAIPGNAYKTYKDGSSVLLVSTNSLWLPKRIIFLLLIIK